MPRIRPGSVVSGRVFTRIWGGMTVLVRLGRIGKTTMAKESGAGWTLGISGEQAMAGLAEYARLIRAEADKVMLSDYRLPLPNSGDPSGPLPTGLIELSAPITDEDFSRFKSRWHEDAGAYRVTQLYSGPTTITPPRTYQEPPVEAFAECPACRTQHYPFITGHDKVDTFDALVTRVLYVLRECQYCQYGWRQQEPA